MRSTPGVSMPPPRDDTIELAYRLRQPNLTVTLDVGRVFRCRTVAVGAGVTLVIPATTVIELIDDGSAATRNLWLAQPGITITGEGTIRGTSQARTAVYGLIAAVGADDLEIEGITLHTSPGQGIWLYGGTGVRIHDLTVHDTGADGIQLTRGVSDFEVVDNVIYDTGDDGVGVISYTTTGDVEHPPCQSGLVARNQITNVTVGRGVAVSGGKNVVVNQNTIDGTDQAGIIIAGGSAAWRGDNVTVSNNSINDTGRDIPSGGVGHGIYVTQTDTAAVTGNTVDNSAVDGIRLVDATSTNLTESGNTIGTVAGTPIVRQ